MGCRFTRLAMQRMAKNTVTKEAHKTCPARFRVRRECTDRTMPDADRPSGLKPAVSSIDAAVGMGTEAGGRGCPVVLGSSRKRFPRRTLWLFSDPVGSYYRLVSGRGARRRRGLPTGSGHAPCYRVSASQGWPLGSPSQVFLRHGRFVQRPAGGENKISTTPSPTGPPFPICQSRPSFSRQLACRDSEDARQDSGRTQAPSAPWAAVPGRTAMTRR